VKQIDGYGGALPPITFDMLLPDYHHEDAIRLGKKVTGGQAPIDRLGLERRGGIHWLMFIANILSIEYTA
jgi:hypothetical protein